MNSRRLCRLDDLPLHSARGFDPESRGEDTIFVVRTEQGVRAFINRCPHQGTPLEYRKDAFLSADGLQIVCYAHGARFETDSGLCVRGPCIGERLILRPCSISDGWVWLSER